MFRRILVANRGEIAVRIIRAARELGMETVAVFSEPDREALHVRMADRAVGIGPGPSRESYLVGEKIVEAALQTGAEAIHPGYGFLSENPSFARLVRKAGLVFVGPSPEAMEAMGDKVRARRNALASNVPVSPGSDGPVDATEARTIADRIGFPVMIKAVHGGGGMGLRPVHTPEELEKALEEASRQAASAFGSGEVFVEKLIESPRHIEFQVLGDEHGHVVHLGERECSIQRRNQKLLEETPSVALTGELREEMGEKVRRLARSVGYSSAGTMEFLYKDGKFYFMEMNTRLQVEHPVTELVTGLDLVKLQFRIASGEVLPFEQEEVRMNGHALEVRINSEDPYRGFVPSPGRVEAYLPPGGPGIRVDSGLYAGWTIPSFYDSLALKIVSWGRTRSESVARMRRALDELVLEGPKTNVPFHKIVLRDEAFIRGDLSTRFIEERGILRLLENEEKERWARKKKRAAAIAAALERAPGGGIRGFHHRSNYAPIVLRGTSAWAEAARRAGRGM